MLEQQRGPNVWVLAEPDRAQPLRVDTGGRGLSAPRTCERLRVRAEQHVAEQCLRRALADGGRQYLAEVAVQECAATAVLPPAGRAGEGAEHRRREQRCFPAEP